MRENRPYGSEGGEPQRNAAFLPLSFVGCVQIGFVAVFAVNDKTKNGGIIVPYFLSHLTYFNRIDYV